MSSLIFLRSREELRVSERGHEGFAQRRNTLPRHVGRQRERRTEDRLANPSGTRSGGLVEQPQVTRARLRTKPGNDRRKPRRNRRFPLSTVRNLASGGAAEP